MKFNAAVFAYGLAKENVLHFKILNMVILSLILIILL